MSARTHTNPGQRAPGRAVTSPPDRRSVARLQRRNEYPSVSLIAADAGNDSTLKVRLSGLARDARRRLVAEYGTGHPTVETLTAELTRQIDQVVATGAPAVGVFVSPTFAVWYPITEPASERVIIDDTFATRDLVHAQLRGTHTYVLHFAATSRLFSGTGHRFTEHRGATWPVELSPSRERDRSQRHGLREPSATRDRDLQRQVRDIDQAMTGAFSDDPRPLIVVGSSRRVAAFAATSRHRDHLAAQIAWGGRLLSSGQVAGLCAAAVDDIIEQRTTDALAAIDDAIKAGRLTTGIGNSWEVAAQGLADLVVVEHGYTQAGRIDPDTGTVIEASDREAPDVIDDLVDDLIEQVLARRGRVAIVADGVLADHQRVAVCARA